MFKIAQYIFLRRCDVTTRRFTTRGSPGAVWGLLAADPSRGRQSLKRNTCRRAHAAGGRNMILVLRYFGDRCYALYRYKLKLCLPAHFYHGAVGRTYCLFPLSGGSAPLDKVSFLPIVHLLTICFRCVSSYNFPFLHFLPRWIPSQHDWTVFFWSARATLGKWLCWLQTKTGALTRGVRLKLLLGFLLSWSLVIDIKTPLQQLVVLGGSISDMQIRSVY